MLYLIRNVLCNCVMEKKSVRNNNYYILIRALFLMLVIKCMDMIKTHVRLKLNKTLRIQRLNAKSSARDVFSPNAAKLDSAYMQIL